MQQLNNKKNNRAKGTARENETRGRQVCCINDGKTMSTLRAELEKIGQAELLKRNNKAIVAMPDQVAAALRLVDMTMHQLFQKAGVPLAQLRDEDGNVLAMLEQCNSEQIRSTVQIIRGLQRPWWVEQEKELDNTVTGAKTNYILQIRLGTVFRKRFFSSPRNEWFPHIQGVLDRYIDPSMEECRYDKINMYKTDDIPTFCWDFQVPYSYYMKGKGLVPFYSRNLEADSCFCEYLYLSQPLHPIVKNYLTCVLSAGGKGAGT